MWENSIENLVDALFIKLARAYHTEKSIGPNRHEQKLLELRGIISKNVKKSWTVAEMAANVGLSASRFSVLYKKRFGLSPNDDLIKMRIDQAKLLLLSTDSNLLEIAQLCGFQNEYYFSRVFHKYEKISPGIYRREESAGKNSM